MQETGQSRTAAPGVCPFVALVGNRDRRADGPDVDNRCYAEPAPRQRDEAYQEEFCYSPRFASCTVFLAWAARNAAEPTYVTDAARRAWGSGIAAPEPAAGNGDDAFDATPRTASEPAAPGTPEGGLFGSPTEDESAGPPSFDGFDWVPATAWEEVPVDERAEAEAAELAAMEEHEGPDPEEIDLDRLDLDGDDEAVTAPRIPAALPMRRRKRPLQPIRTRGSGEWFYADPQDREPLVARRYGVAPPILLAALGLLVAALIVFMIPTLLAGGGDPGTAAAPSPSSAASRAPQATRAPADLATPSVEPSPEGTPVIRTYRVKTGDTLTGIADRFGVRPSHLQCMNRILRRNIIVVGERLTIPPDGFTCPPGWRRATPEPEPLPEG